jgi:hypothetical protein
MDKNSKKRDRIEERRADRLEQTTKTREATEHQKKPRRICSAITQSGTEVDLSIRAGGGGGRWGRRREQETAAGQLTVVGDKGWLYVSGIGSLTLVFVVADVRANRIVPPGCLRVEY